jgi:hypothetical protein
MSTNKNNISYSASDIEKYRKGELSAGDMHDLEQAALDDPFLADAIEGLIQYPISPQDLTDLQDRLNKKVTGNNRRAATLLIRRRIAVAAAVILLVGIGFTFFYHHSDQPQRTSQAASTATTKAPETPANTPPAAESKAAADKAESTVIAFTQPRTTRSTQPRTTRATRATPTRRQRRPATSDSTAVASAAPPPIGQSVQPAVLPATVVSNFDKQESAIAREKNYQNPPNPHSLQIEKDTVVFLPSLKKETSTEQYFNFRPTEPLVLSGKVLDINNRPLAGASLTFKGNTPSGTVTDNEGFFKLSLPRADTTIQLTISMIGYNQAYLTLNGLRAEARTSNVIYLKPNNASLDEVVVTGYGAKRKAMQAGAPAESTEQLDTNWSSATPVIGRQAYLQYIQGSRGKLGLDSTITGTETVSFIVSRDGSLSAFKIEQSLSPAHDAAIIRLVTDGPAWRLLRNRKVRAAVTVNF